MKKEWTKKDILKKKLFDIIVYIVEPTIKDTDVDKIIEEQIMPMIDAYKSKVPTIDTIMDIFPEYLQTITIYGDGEPNIPHQQVILKKNIPDIARAIDAHYKSKVPKKMDTTNCPCGETNCDTENVFTYETGYNQAVDDFHKEE